MRSVLCLVLLALVAGVMSGKLLKQKSPVITQRQSTVARTRGSGIGNKFGNIKKKFGKRDAENVDQPEPRLIFDAIKEKTASAFGTIRDKTANAFGKIRDKTVNAFEAIKSKLGLGDDDENEVRLFVGAIEDKTASTFGAIRDKTANALGTIREKTENALGTIKSNLE